MATPAPVLSFTSVNPATGQVVVRVEGTPLEALAEVMARARRAQAAWASMPLDLRCDQVENLAEVLYARREELADLVTRETGKPKAEALFADVLIALEAAKYYDNQAEDILAGESVPHQNLVAKTKRGRLTYLPLGVIAIISPWNYPLAIPLTQMIAAVVGGNSVILKPSEVTPGCGQAIAECFAAAGFPADVVQVIQGGSDLGAALIEERPDKVVFTGSTAAGKQVAAACARHLIPSVLELGGKDAMLVLADADVEAASSAAVWGAFTNCGQACISIERIFVDATIAGRFTQGVVEKTRQLRLGPGSDADTEIGPLIDPRAADRVESLVREAAAGGAEILAGGNRRTDLGPCYFEPTVVTNVNQRMALMREPVFGPVVAIESVSSAEEAVARTNECAYGLSASIWTANAAGASEIGAQVRNVGAVMVNDVASYFGIVEAPHGGKGASGWGRTHSRLGLLEMVQVRYTDVDWLPRRPKTWWFGYDQALLDVARHFIDFAHAPVWRKRWRGAAGAVRALFRGHRI